MNSIIQSLIIIMLLYNAIENNTLGMFELILTLISVSYNLVTDTLFNEGD